MCIIDSNVSPYLRRRLRSHQEVMRKQADKPAGRFEPTRRMAPPPAIGLERTGTVNAPHIRESEVRRSSKSAGPRDAGLALRGPATPPTRESERRRLRNATRAHAIAEAIGRANRRKAQDYAA